MNHDNKWTITRRTSRHPRQKIKMLSLKQTFGIVIRNLTITLHPLFVTRGHSPLTSILLDDAEIAETCSSTE